MYIFKREEGGFYQVTGKQYCAARTCARCKLRVPDEDLIKVDGALYSRWATWDSRKKLPINTCKSCHEKYLRQT